MAAKTPTPRTLTPREGKRPIGRAEAYLAKMNPAIQGQGGSKQLWKVACTLTRDFGLSENEAWFLIQSWNARCLPPWREYELKRAIERSATLVAAQKSRFA